jgi:predicted nuclease with RNAse H fold
LRDGAYFNRFHSTDPGAVAAWVRRIAARAVAVDAPCRWRRPGGAREAERALAGLGIRCFATPSRQAALAHPFYAWMRNGMSLYRRLSSAYPLLSAPGSPKARVCFETFPQAVACALAGRRLAARNKRADRRALLEAAGVEASSLGSIDWIDAALCALAAHRYLLGKAQRLGNPGGGFLVLPYGPSR